jgi:hypothetical protein
MTNARRQADFGPPGEVPCAAGVRKPGLPRKPYEWSVIAIWVALLREILGGIEYVFARCSSSKVGKYLAGLAQ